MTYGMIHNAHFVFQITGIKKIGTLLPFNSSVNGIDATILEMQRRLTFAATKKKKGVIFATA